MLDMSNGILSPIQQDPKSELIVVMVITPMFLNGFQIWIQDSYLKDDGNID